jgi:hypothetical protein
MPPSVVNGGMAEQGQAGVVEATPAEHGSGDAGRGNRGGEDAGLWLAQRKTVRARGEVEVEGVEDGEERWPATTSEGGDPERAAAGQGREGGDGGANAGVERGEAELEEGVAGAANREPRTGDARGRSGSSEIGGQRRRGPSGAGEG